MRLHFKKKQKDDEGQSPPLIIPMFNDRESLYVRVSLTTTKFYFARRFKIASEAGRKKTPWLIASINRGGHYLLTKVVMENRLANLINQGGQV